LQPFAWSRVPASPALTELACCKAAFSLALQVLTRHWHATSHAPICYCCLQPFHDNRTGCGNGRCRPYLRAHGRTRLRLSSTLALLATPPSTVFDSGASWTSQVVLSRILVTSPTPAILLVELEVRSIKMRRRRGYDDFLVISILLVTVCKGERK